MVVDKKHDSWSNLSKQEHEAAADAKRIVAKGSDGVNFPTIAVDSDGHVQVDILSGGAGTGTEYTEGDTTPDPKVGALAMGEASGGSVQPLQVNASKSLHINIASSDVALGGGTQYAETDIAAADMTGTIAMGETIGDNLRLPLLLDSSQHLQVDIAADSTAGLATSAKQLADGHNVTIDNTSVTVDGTITEASGAAIKTAVESIESAVAVDDTDTHTPASTKVMGIGAVATPTDTSVAANDIGMPAMSTDRRLHVDSQIVGTDAPLDVSGATVTVDNAGTFAVQVDGDALTALQLIDDPVATDDTTTHTAATTKVMGIGAVATPTDALVDANDIGMPGMSLDRRLHTEAVGNIAHDAADAGNPVKVGGVGRDYTPGSTEGRHGTAISTANDRANLAMNEYGELVTAVNPAFFLLTGMDILYGTTTTFFGDVTDVTPWREAMLQFDIEVTQGTPTYIRVEIYGSANGTNFAKLRNDGLATMVFSAATINAAPSGILNFAVTFRIPCMHLKFRVVATGTGASDDFTIDNSALSLKT